MKQLFLSLLIFGSFSNSLHSQSDEDIEKISEIYEQMLTNSSCYDWLRYLCKNIGHRLGGSPQYAAAVKYTSEVFKEMGVDKIWTQPVEVPYWERGTVEKAQIINSRQVGTQELSVAALGFSAGTDALGVTGEVIEVQSLDELGKMSVGKVRGKIVFFNRPMDATRINTFHAYGAAGDQRTSGPKKAAEMGALASITRSLTLKHDDVPHSGVTIFGDQKPIPAVGIGLESADFLSELLKKESKVRVNITLNCQHLGKRIAHNVIGEITGSKYPDEIIVVGGHLDSWDIGEGAHDDGAGVVQAMEVLNQMIKMDMKPQRTVRCVLFANEENGLYGATVYADEAKKKGEKHIAALESDAGGHTPRGFTMDAQKDLLKPSYATAQEWRSVLAPYGLYYLQTGGSAADISRLKSHGAVLFGFRPDSQRYFDFHHARTDVFETVHKRELVLGAASMSALVYLIDKYGFENSKKD